MRELRERTLFPSTVTLFGAKMNNSASEPIDLDVTDASTASKRPQWILPPLSTRSMQPAVAFCRTQGIYSIGGLAKLISLRCSKWPSTVSVSQLPAVRLSELSAAANIQSLTTEAA